MLADMATENYSRVCSAGKERIFIVDNLCISPSQALPDGFKQDF